MPNNKIRGNQPIDVGYYYSYVNLGLYDDQHPNSWSCPLDNIRLGLSDDGLEVAANQLLDLMQSSNFPFGQAERLVNSADSGYSSPKYIHPLVSKCDNLNLVIRLRAGMKVYLPYQGEQKDRGRKKTYNQTPYYLQLDNQKKVFNPHTKTYQIKEQTPIFDLECNETYEFEKVKLGKEELLFLY